MRRAYVAGACAARISRQTTSATATSTAQSSSARPVCCSTGISAGTGGAAEHGAHARGAASDQEAEPDQRPPRRGDGDRDDRGGGGEHQQQVERPGPAGRRAPRRGCACRRPCRSGCRAGCWRPGSRRPARRCRPRRTAPPTPSVSVWTYVVPIDGDQPEEHEDHHLAEPEVAVRLRAAGVEPGRDARRPGRPRPATRRWWRRAPGPATPATPNARNAARFTARGGRRPGADQPHRADPVVVGAADAVGVVVGVVDRDLEGQAHDEREQRLPPDDAVDVRRDAGAGEDRGRRRPGGCADARRRASRRGWPPEDSSRLARCSPRVVGLRKRSAARAAGWMPIAASDDDGRR